MAERPILFSGPMVRAILAGQKTQTRRPVKPQPGNPEVLGVSPIWGRGVPLAHVDAQRRFGIHAAFPVNGRRVDRWLPCPYGAPGDRLWVREAFSLDRLDVYPCPPAWYRADFDEDLRDVREHSECDPPTRCRLGPSGECFHGVRFKPGIHMPRRLCRATLEVEGVRVERLDAITEEDAKAEGMRFDGRWWLGGRHPVKGTSRCLPTARDALLDRWDGMYGGGPFARAANPWVWAVTFRRVEVTRG